MYDINLSYVKKGKLFYGFFLFMGLAMSYLIIYGAGAGLINDLKEKDSKVMSSRVDIIVDESEQQITYNKIYYYIVNGKEYIYNPNSKNTSLPNSKNHMIVYSSLDPSNSSLQSGRYLYLIMTIFLILPIFFIIYSIKKMKKISKRIKKIEELNKIGKLVKNLSYELIESGMSVNKKPILMPKVEYTLPNGKSLILLGDPRHDRVLKDEDGLIDLIIDETNLENYFLDYNINRIDGNREEDYYQKNIYGKK